VWEVISLKLHIAEIRALRALGVPPGIIYYVNKGGGVGKKYAPIFARVLGRTLEEVLYPDKETEDKGVGGMGAC
jgi:hypothetical protein